MYVYIFTLINFNNFLLLHTSKYTQITICIQNTHSTSQNMITDYVIILLEQSTITDNIHVVCGTIIRTGHRYWITLDIIHGTT